MTSLNRSRKRLQTDIICTAVSAECYELEVTFVKTDSNNPEYNSSVPNLGYTGELIFDCYKVYVHIIMNIHVKKSIVEVMMIAIQYKPYVNHIQAFLNMIALNYAEILMGINAMFAKIIKDILILNALVLI